MRATTEALAEQLPTTAATVIGQVLMACRMSATRSATTSPSMIS